MGRLKLTSVLILCLAVGVVIFVALDVRMSGGGGDFALIKTWNETDGNLKTDLTEAQKEEISRETRNTVSEGVKKTLDKEHKIDVAASVKETKFSQTDVEKFVRAAVPAIMSFGFLDFEKKQAANARYFTKRGYVSFYNAVKAAGLQQMIEQRQALARPELLCVRNVTQDIDEYGRVVWKANIVAKYEYITGKEFKHDFHEVVMVVMDKEDESVAYQPGLGIRQWVVTGVPSSEEQARRLCTP